MSKIMNMSKAAIAALGMTTCITAAAVADMPEKPNGFPNRPVTLLIGWGAGGGVDQVARQLAVQFEKITGQPLVVINKPGGRGTVVLADFMNAASDGYTLMGGSDDLVGQYAAKGINENPFKDWTPIIIPQVTFTQIYRRAEETKFTDWDSFVAYAKANPGNVRLTNSGPAGGAERIMATKLAEVFDIKINQTQFDKASERYGSILGGHVDVMMEQPGDVNQYIEGSQFVPVLSLLNERPDTFADTQSIKDIGADVRPFLKWRAFWAKGDVPDERKKYLEAAFKAAWETEEFQKFNRSKYMHIVKSYYGIDEAVELMEGDLVTFRETLKAMGLLK